LIFSYCDATAICQPEVDIGGSCFATSNCVPGSQCLGPVGAKTCIANGNPGDACETDPGENSTVPICGSPLQCVTPDPDLVPAVCIYGLVGDSCKENSDCLGLLTCTGNVCTALPDTTNCTSSSDCSPLSYCDSKGFRCTPKKPAGSTCDSLEDCVFGNLCSYQYDGATDKTCIEAFTKENGEFCSSSPECKSKRCAGNRCAKSSDVSCTNSEQCAYDEFCGCGGIQLYGGYGKCFPDPCTKKYEVHFPSIFSFFSFFFLLFFFCTWTIQNLGLLYMFEQKLWYWCQWRL